MAAEDKHLAEAAARSLSPGQLLSLSKMEPKTLGVSRRCRVAPPQMSQQFWGRLPPPLSPAQEEASEPGARGRWLDQARGPA